MEILPKYQTFWPRFWAGWIDVLMFLPLYWIDLWLEGRVSTPVLVAIWYTTYTLSADIYSVTMHAAYGQTVGKMIMGVKVLDLTGTKLSVRQALLRDCVPIVFSITALFQGLPLVMAGLSPYQTDVEIGWAEIMTLGGSVLWFAGELLTMLTNAKRRAIHDYIAGSVVVRMDSEASVGANAA